MTYNIYQIVSTSCDRNYPYDLIRWMRLGRRYRPSVYRELIFDYDRLEDPMVEEDRVNFLFEPHEACKLLDYLTRYVEYSRHSIVAADIALSDWPFPHPNGLESLGTWDLTIDDGFIAPFEVFGDCLRYTDQLKGEDVFGPSAIDGDRLRTLSRGQRWRLN